MSNIKAIKLINGIEIIGKVENGRDGTWKVIKNPMAVEMMQNGKGEVGIGLAPVALSNSDISSIDIDDKHILFMIDVDKEIEKSYIKQTSGIELVTAL